MKIIMVAVCIVAAVLTCTQTSMGGGAVSPVSVGKVIAIEGKATALGVNGKLRDLALGSTVYLDDKINTQASAKIQVMFEDESLISQGEKSELVIDKYVYDPQNAKTASSSMKLIKGVFRVISGKVADLNPERFKVQTKMATIGIRGCELGFRLNNDKEDIYILDLPKGKSILVWRFGYNETIPEGNIGRDRMMSILEQGVAVSLGQGLALEQRGYAPADARKLVQEATPDLKAGGDQVRAEPQSAAGGAIPSGVAENAARASQSGLQSSLQSTLDTRLAELSAVPPPVEEPEQQGQEQPQPPPPEDGPTTAPYVEPPTTQPPVMVGGSPMSDWEWGIWENGTVQYKPNASVGATFLSATEFQALAGATTPYNLSGSGGAAAVLHHAPSGLTKQVQGSCSLNVSVGGGAPKWDGSFNMSNADGDFLNFAVSPGSGAIGADGKLSFGTLSIYSMQVNGAGFAPASISQKSFEGLLIKPGLGTPPISGASGKFQFLHGSTASANGAFGVQF
ncbi:MAG: hypothetical protein C0404_04330 [Verrucomicrobia bacterium]|nr:hypothetical protein [Verrucomicrobiota bacterium]